MQNNAGIWVFAHSNNDQVPQVAFELIGKAKELGDSCDEKVFAVIIGAGLNQSVQKAFQYGADEVIFVDEANLKDYDANSYANVLGKLIEKYRPNSLLFGADSIGRDLAPRIGVRLETGISADCIGLDMIYADGAKLLIQKKPYLNGEVIVDILCKEKRPQIATVKPGIIPLKEADLRKNGHGIKERVEVSSVELLSKILAFIPKTQCNQDLCKAPIVVAGGSGFKTKKDFDALYELADLLGGVVGATRPLVQEGWIAKEYQIGQSGIAISPKLYIAFGISGSVMHTCGVVKPGTVIAVNKDPEAAIFNFADYGVVGDCKQLLTSLIEVLKEKKVS